MCSIDNSRRGCAAGNSKYHCCMYEYLASGANSKILTYLPAALDFEQL